LTGSLRIWSDEANKSVAIPERSHQVKTDLSVQRYLADGLGARRVRHCQTTATPMFAAPGAATATVWVNASHIAKDNARPLGLIGGST
jgi:hypothetical protein